MLIINKIILMPSFFVYKVANSPFGGLGGFKNSISFLQK
jgi:hypothetical protein